MSHTPKVDAVTLQTSNRSTGFFKFASSSKAIRKRFFLPDSPAAHSLPFL